MSGKMYWTDTITDKIQRANLDGTEVENLITTGLSNPRGISLDPLNNKMYWADQDHEKIYRANLNGSGMQDLITAPDNAILNYLALDIAGGKLYWTDVWRYEISRADLDGKNIEVLLDHSEVHSPLGIALDVEVIPEPATLLLLGLGSLILCRKHKT